MSSCSESGRKPSKAGTIKLTISKYCGILNLSKQGKESIDAETKRST